MTRLLLLILLAWLVWLGVVTLAGRLRAFVHGGALPAEPRRVRRVSASVRRAGGEELVSCERCGVRIPRSRAVARGSGERGEGLLCGSCGAG